VRKLCGERVSINRCRILCYFALWLSMVRNYVRICRGSCSGRLVAQLLSQMFNIGCIIQYSILDVQRCNQKFTSFKESLTRWDRRTLMFKKKISICGVWCLVIFITRDLRAFKIICCSESCNFKQILFVVPNEDAYFTNIIIICLYI